MVFVFGFAKNKHHRLPTITGNPNDPNLADLGSFYIYECESGVAALTLIYLILSTASH